MKYFTKTIELETEKKWYEKELNKIQKRKNLDKVIKFRMITKYKNRINNINNKLKKLNRGE